VLAKSPFMVNIKLSHEFWESVIWQLLRRCPDFGIERPGLWFGAKDFKKISL
jgi:hypothetical protein